LLEKNQNTKESIDLISQDNVEPTFISQIRKNVESQEKIQENIELDELPKTSINVEEKE
jgi:hypothetical protein